MPRTPAPRAKPPVTLSLKLGDWLEANATGWAVLVVPLVILLLAGAASLLGFVG